ncbi:hypothetical protein Krad_4583 (plasmid) [Kineococcus radiotolerans SRS30216 = ATCC BAA-149]|uniref:Uncharacterized protein n=1 Tax=Kineococcus radiotolerans (strain ATCC BAA-149 / DSM 14245 / SRS30216) TaxID=266940 RepID=A6WGV3_KINRD|nr:hypothetical protein Krad_4583 [Kineococcus radiotolerans SRS30216 = ATCC BAA-149]
MLSGRCRWLPPSAAQPTVVAASRSVARQCPPVIDSPFECYPSNDTSRSSRPVQAPALRHLRSGVSHQKGSTVEA